MRSFGLFCFCFCFALLCFALVSTRTVTPARVFIVCDLQRIQRAYSTRGQERDPTPSAAETDMYHWKNANLEFANAAKLDSISLGQWDQDDPYNFEGDHVLVPGGNARLIAALAREIPVFYDHAVTNIKYPPPPTTEVKEEGASGKVKGEDREDEIDGGGGGRGGDASGSGSGSGERGDGTPLGKVEVTCANGRTFEGDAVLVTVPLGVLKRDVIAFEPPLPERKRRAIADMGFGVLNKVILLFPEVFWDTDHDTFGYVTAGDAQRRGRYFLFYNYAGVSGGAVLVALVAGQAALEFEDVSDAEGVAGEAFSSSCFLSFFLSVCLFFFFFSAGGEGKGYIMGTFSPPVIPFRN